MLHLLPGIFFLFHTTFRALVSETYPFELLPLTGTGHPRALVEREHMKDQQLNLHEGSKGTYCLANKRDLILPCLDCSRLKCLIGYYNNCITRYNQIFTTWNKKKRVHAPSVMQLLKLLRNARPPPLKCWRRCICFLRWKR